MSYVIGLMSSSFATVFKVYDNQRQIDIFGLPLIDLLGALTFLIVLLTLYASLRAARESARANMLSSLPLITLSYDHSKDEVIVENSGSGIAINVKVDSFYNWWADGQFNLYGLTKILFLKMPILRHGDRRVLQATIKGVTDPFGLTKFTMFSKKQRPLTFAIRFSDLAGQRYITKIRIEDSSAYIVSSPQRLSMLNWLKLGIMRLGELATMVRYAIKVKRTQYRDKKAKQKKA